jgi:hypothetical protein
MTVWIFKKVYTCSMRTMRIAGAVLISLAYASVALAWTVPTAAPPNGNVAAPLNTGSVEQVKTGPITNIQLTSVGTAPSPVTNKLYNVGGTLYFNGSPVAGGGGGTVGGSGAANYVSKFTGASTLGNSQIYDNGSTVGINSLGQEGKLRVYGGAGPPWAIYASGSTSGVYGAGSDPNGWGGQFYGGYGVYGDASLANASGVRGHAPSGYGGYFTGSTGVYASAGAGNGVTGVSTSQYGGYFTGAGGVYGVNSSGYYGFLGYPGSSWGVLTNGNMYASDYYVSGTGQWLSQGGSSGAAFGGAFEATFYCVVANPYTGGCSCPGSYNQYHFGYGILSGNNAASIPLYFCSKGNPV